MPERSAAEIVWDLDRIEYTWLGPEAGAQGEWWMTIPENFHVD